MNRASQRPQFPQGQHLPSFPPPMAEWPPRHVRVRAARSGLPLWAWLAIGGGALAVIAVVATLVIVVAGSVSTRAEERRAIRDLEQTAEQFRQQQLAALNAEEPLGDVGESYRAYLSTIEAKAANLGGDDRRAADAGLATLRSVEPQVLAYAKATNALEQAGSIDAATFINRADLDGRIRLVRDLRASSEQLATATQGLEARFAQELRTQGVAERNIQAALSGFRSAARLDVTLQLHRDEVAACDVMVKMMELLKREWGDWEVDEVGDVVFRRTAPAMQYNRMIEELYDISMRLEQGHRQALQSPPVKRGRP